MPASFSTTLMSHAKTGKPENYGRRYRVCTTKNCKGFMWIDNPLPLHMLPFDIQTRIAMADSVSTQEAPAPGPLVCAGSACQDKRGIPRYPVLTTMIITPTTILSYNRPIYQAIAQVRE
ncbi:hypothetical protein BOTBODRAFT_182276 [Botryobasidium botryosum FD-172 SS1]|uniref:Zinc finger GRF-type domain-containing protein n=1 Tax=Botryobasidium botryosum (strain FD-172 SS1) TaxID=930990 RepID=A0A067LRU5_BOTB1|nr:hypothetical protein BOTBODRAFT_182276 [Botryobasidium botryosum FD-172 SS1]